VGDIRSTGTYASSVVYTRHTDTSWVWKQMRMEIVLSSILRWMSDNGFCWTNDELNVYIALYIGTCCMLRFYLSHFSLFRLLIYLFYVDTIIKRVFINYTLCLLWLSQCQGVRFFVLVYSLFITHQHMYVHDMRRNKHNIQTYYRTRLFWLKSDNEKVIINSS